MSFGAFFSVYKAELQPAVPVVVMLRTMKNRPYYAFVENCLKEELEIAEFKGLNERESCHSRAIPGVPVRSPAAGIGAHLVVYTALWAGNYCLRRRVLRTGMISLMSLPPMADCHR